MRDFWERFEMAKKIAGTLEPGQEMTYLVGAFMDLVERTTSKAEQCLIKGALDDLAQMVETEREIMQKAPTRFPPPLKAFIWDTVRGDIQEEIARILRERCGCR